MAVFMPAWYRAALGSSRQLCNWEILCVYWARLDFAHIESFLVQGAR